MNTFFHFCPRVSRTNIAHDNNMNSPIKCWFVVWGPDPDIQGWDERLCVPVMVHPTGHLVPSSCLLQYTHTHAQLKLHWNWIYSIIQPDNTRNNLNVSLISLDLWPVVWFAEGGLVVCIWAVPFPAFAAVPSQECQGSSSGLQHKSHGTKNFLAIK